MDRITRKELKQDKFAQEVGHTVRFLGAHRRQAVGIGIAAILIVVLVVGLLAYRRQQHAARQEALAAVLQVHHAPIGPAQNEFTRTFPTEQERTEAAIKEFSELASRYPGTDEGTIAVYYLGVLAADQGKLEEAEKSFREVADSRNRQYAALAKLSLGDIYRSQGRLEEGEKLLRSLMDNPNEFVSREQATIALARLLSDARPEEARSLLEPLRTERGTISRVSVMMLGELPPAPAASE